MKINEDRYDILQAAIRLYTYEKDFDIYTLNTDIFTRHDPAVYGVNWSATGTQNAETTRAFAESLIKATEIVDKLNEMQIKRVWDTEDKYIKTKEEYEYSRNMLVKAFETGNYVLLWDFVVAGSVED